MCDLPKKRKRANSTRVMTWNAHGLNDANKRRKLDDFIKKGDIDVAFIQEGSQHYKNPVEETCMASTSYKIAPTDESLSLLFQGKGDIKPNGGKARRTPYNMVFDADKWEIGDDQVEVDYASSKAISDWIRKPLTEAEAKGLVEVSGSSRRKALKEKKGGTLNKLRGEVQKRVDMLSHQRPKCLKSKTDERKIFCFHSPLGGETTLDNLGLEKIGKTDFSGSGAFGSGGQVASCANILFRMHVSGFDEANEVVGSMPDHVIYLGDTNVRAGGMGIIFPGQNLETSSDGLCHIVTSYPMTLVSNTHNPVAVGSSDHDWVIADIENPTTTTS